MKDVDGDGLPDFVVDAPGMTVYRNTSTPGHFSMAPGVPFTGSYGAGGGAVVADLDNDGRNDIAAVGYSGGMVTINRNTGSPGMIAFAPQQLISVSGNPAAITSGDIDGDGKTDLMYYTAGTAGILRNTSVTGSISFAQPITLTVPGVSSQGLNIALVDYDGDGKLDIIVLNDNDLNIFLNTSTPGNISFAPVISTSLGMIGQGASLSNYGGGSVPDILDGSFNAEYYLLYRNISRRGTVSNDPPFQLSGAVSYTSDGADFDGDGKPDIATIYYYGGTSIVEVLKNAVGAPQTFQTCTSSTATLSSDMTGTVYQWQRDIGSGFVNIADNDTASGTATATLAFNNAPVTWNGYRYRCHVDSIYSSVFSLVVITSIDHGVAITTNDSVICYGTPVTFNATALDTSNNYSFLWLVNNTGTTVTGNSFTSTTLQNNDTVQALLYLTDACGSYTDISRPITMKATEVPDSITISTPTLTPCSGTPVVFTATTVNAGADPTYAWTVNRIIQAETGPVFTTSSLSPDAADGINRIQATLNGTTACAFPANPVSNQIDVSVIQSLSPIAQVFVSTTTICQGTDLTFSATAVNTVTGTTYDWLINGVDAGSISGTFTTDSLHNNDTVQCLVTGNMVCAASDSAISDPIVITVNPATAPSVTIASSDTAICAGANVTFTATPENGGSSPVYQWRKNGVDVGQNDPTYTVIGLANGDAITVLLTSNATCITPDTASSYPIVMTVSAPAILISGDTAVAPGEQAVITATISGAGSNPGYQWQDSTAAHTWQNINGANNVSISYIPASSGDRVRCILTGAADCIATSNALLLEVSSGISPTRYYPNPVTSTLYIENPNSNDPLSSISVVDIMGNHCITLTNINGQALISVDAATLAKGIYTVTLLNSSGKVSHFSFVKL